jgi:UDP-2,3-diacylglucosamine hydrolase
MHAAAEQGAIAVISGAGTLPVHVAQAIARRGAKPLIVAIAGEAEPSAFGDSSGSVRVLQWGEIGRFRRLLEEEGCREAVFVGTITRRPDFRATKLDLGAVRLLPKILPLLGAGDDQILRAVAGTFEEFGVSLVSPLAVAPELAVPQGLLAGRRLGPRQQADLRLAAEAARRLGDLDIGQGAVAIGGRVVAVEGAEGTDGLLHRVAELRRKGRVAAKGGVLVKCMKPSQDPRLDVPAVGAASAEAARAAGLDGVAAEAGRTILVGRDKTIEAFRRAGLFLMGWGGDDRGP